MTQAARWCAYCVEEVHRKHGRFIGAEGLNPGVTRVGGTLVCVAHTEQALHDQERLGRLEDEITELGERVAEDCVKPVDVIDIVRNAFPGAEVVASG